VSLKKLKRKQRVLEGRRNEAQQAYDRTYRQLINQDKVVENLRDTKWSYPISERVIKQLIKTNQSLLEDYKVNFYLAEQKKIEVDKIPDILV
jgi:hypothetical protein